MRLNRTKYIKLLPWLLGGCILISLYMRATLFHMGFEYDELFTAITTDPTLPFGWLYSHYLLVDVHPPLYNALLWVWNHFVPYGPELWLRLPSFLMGVGALTMAWGFFPKRFGKKARLLFVTLLSCSSFAIAYSQHARAYMLILLFAVPLTFVFLQMARFTWNKRPIPAHLWEIFGGLSLLLCWSHYFGALLFVVFSFVLLTQAIYYKRKLTLFLAVPALVILCFLPWIIPNFIQQLQFHRLNGNWWANQHPYWHIFIISFIFWAGNFKAAVIMGSLLVGLAVDRKFLSPQKPFLYWRKEQFVLGLTLILFVVCVALISIKMYLFINRYFIVLLPIVYMMITLFLAPLLHKRWIVGVGILCFVLCNLENFWTQHTKYLKFDSTHMPSRSVAQQFRDRFAGKQMFVVALEAFPPVTMPALYGFYVNKVYHLNIPVTELFYLDESTRNKLLARQKEAVIWMPNCTDEKLAKLSQDWQRTIYIKERQNLVCFLEIN